ncbi:hypothetical protein [Micromonospora carbonacea]|uniref:Uncharacterized protein n=1 Tax=Micromonospora carbonacea TaxID=47853 RepID=A0A1C5A9Z7_9ACTN|nr:hypothetical protein [Micromonospora carbonacea]SCF41901.1 hypothetical protein GA0070563_11213 [Micromonospora carbonacea]
MPRQPFAHQAAPNAAALIAAADAAGHRWFVLETRTGQIIFTDRTCRGARSFAAHIAERPTFRVRAGLYGVGISRKQGSLTITTRDEAIARQQTSPCDPMED